MKNVVLGVLFSVPRMLGVGRSRAQNGVVLEVVRPNVRPAGSVERDPIGAQGAVFRVRVHWRIYDSACSAGPPNDAMVRAEACAAQTSPSWLMLLNKVLAAFNSDDETIPRDA